MANLATFRDDVRGWLDENCPQSMRTPMVASEYPGGGRRAAYENPETKLWLDRCADRGYTAPMWPSEFGGAGLDKQENQVLREEMGRINARPPLVGMGLSMIGPALLEYGNEVQKQEHLPKIVSGDIWWCQGYSEPGSGSDLASLRTSAVEDGDDFVINGQKIWTSGADHADWMFCLVRTDFDAPKHDGISFVLFDMTTPGITVKPIKLISGLSPFCETFMDNVRVPKANLVHELNKGWTVGKRLLQHERSMIGGMGGGQKTTSIEEYAQKYIGTDANGRVDDPVLRAQILRHRMNDRAFALTTRRAVEESATGNAPGAASSMFKYYGTEQNIGKYDLLLSVLGTQSLGWTGEGFDQDELDTTRAWLRSKANSIEGGTSEVQLNIIAKRVLGLPD
ncbi:MAG TPA: acyl-CoA dehydrogenase [Gammaproteobacteria bacterium]|jgi:alkylation response protein AidB-like acyl-CoA dehydrogenase|nr:MAG: acyl-CoA dehydrogenase [Gammaproteobacteria bacterium TMED134]RZO70870.1 MAG: acyl-CoA dehydrogenase [OM182 bacterium]HAL42734.1 acyl-CoA dehydrogenase [Gammaproteobacteria bacterium]